MPSLEHESQITDEYLITGAAGFVGSNLIRYLSPRGSVIGLDRDPVEDAILAPEQCVQLDISSALPDLTIADDTTIVHAAALFGAQNEQTMWDVNVNGTRNILDLAVRAKAKHFVFLSSGGVYGYAVGKYRRETDNTDPIGFYGYTKWIGENLALMYHKLHGLTVTIIRLFFPYGPGQRSGIFPFISQSVSEGRKLTIHKNGSPKMNPIHIDDLVSAIGLVVQNGSGITTYNLCGDETLSFLDIVRLFEKHSGRSANITSSDESEGDLLGDNSLIKQKLGWKPINNTMKQIALTTTH